MNGASSLVLFVHGEMRMRYLISAATLALAVATPSAYASIIFTFMQSGGTVVMTSSGVLDTTKLVAVSNPDGWGGVGTENNGAGHVDIMGGTTVGGGLINAQFTFNPGTDVSDFVNPGGPFAFSFFGPSVTGTRPFTTYSGFVGGLRQAGIGMTAAHIIGGLWTPDQTWTYGPGATFSSIGLIAGTYSASDIQTGESITIQIGAPVSEPASLALLGFGLMGFLAARRRRKV